MKRKMGGWGQVEVVGGGGVGDGRGYWHGWRIREAKNTAASL